jgi:hypothetical protein
MPHYFASATLSCHITHFSFDTPLSRRQLLLLTLRHCRCHRFRYYFIIDDFFLIIFAISLFCRDYAAATPFSRYCFFADADFSLRFFADSLPIYFRFRFR